MELAYDRQRTGEGVSNWKMPVLMGAVEYGSNRERQDEVSAMPVRSAGQSWLEAAHSGADDSSAGLPDWAREGESEQSRGTSTAWRRALAPGAGLETSPGRIADRAADGIPLYGNRALAEQLAAGTEADARVGALGQAGSLEMALLRGLAQAKPSYPALDRLVAEAVLEERQTAFRSQALQEAIARSALSRGEQLALSTALAEGSLQWGAPRLGAPGLVSDFYRFFVIEDAKGPPPDMNRMNCFELVLHSAWRLGQIPTEWIVERGNLPEGELFRISYPELGWSSQLPVVDAAAGRVPATGDMIFVTAPGDAEPWHVILSLGGEEAMSLWKRPALDTPTRRLRLSEYADQTLQFGPAPWNR